jgi:MFS transporter, OFA family, oxalate/formate antiporter
MARWWRKEVPRAIAGAILLDLAVSALFVWDVFTGELSREFDVGQASLAVVFSVGLAAFTAGVLVGGRAADRYPPRRLGLITSAGVVAGLLGSAVARSLIELVVTFGLMLGASTGFGYATAIRVAGTVAHRRGLALGIVVSAYAAGTIILAPLANALLHAVGAPWTFMILAAGIGATALGGACRIPGSAPDHGPRLRHRRGKVIRGAVPILWLVFGLGSAPGLAAFANAGEIAGTPAATALAIPLLSAGNFAGRLIAGPISDRIGRTPALHTNAVLLAAACALLAAAEIPQLILIALLLLGIQYGALSALVPAALSDSTAKRDFGASFGAVFSGWGIAGLTAPVLAAAAAHHTGWNRPFLAFTGMALLTSIAISKA